MRNLLIGLCSLATLFAIFVGGCAGLVTGIAMFDNGRDAFWNALVVSVPVGVAAIVVWGVNAMLIAAVRRGAAPRRSPLLVVLAIIDLVAAAWFVSGIEWNDNFFVTAWLPMALVLKGVLTLMLPSKPPGEPRAEDEVPVSRPTPRE